MGRMPELTALLNTALRTRVASVDELVALTDADPEATREAVGQLQRLGFLSVTSGVITYRRPDVTVSGVSRRLLMTVSEHLDETIANAQDVLQALPGLIQAWNLGNSGEHALPIDVLHGPWAPAEMWTLHFARSTPAHCDLCMPETSLLFDRPRDAASLWAARVGDGLSIRLLLSVADATNPAARARLQAELDAGVEVRMHPHPPSLFWVSDGDTVGIPLEWGQGWPTSVMAVQSPALAAVLAWLFERLWGEALPVGGTGPRSWEPMLRLMSRGLTMEAAAHALGLTPRTGRRRVAEAMAHFGVTSHFSLGAAWGRAQASAPPAVD